MSSPDRFEHPLPAVSISVDALNIETKDNYNSSFVIRNTGGGNLNGKVLSRCPGLTFDPSEWEGNRQTITYTFSASDAGLATGESIQGHVIVSSNGGEIEIPVTARLAKMSIATTEGLTIANLQDFFEYSKTNPAQARWLFVDSEFYMLLLGIGYEYMEVYESLHKDFNRERAMDNFFILSGLKGKTSLSVSSACLEFTQKPGDSEVIHGSIKVQKSDAGYVESPITVRGNSPWLTCYASRLIQSDFDENLTATVGFSIDPSKIAASYAREAVEIGTETTEIVYRKISPVIARINRTSLRYDDKGVLEIINNTGMDIKVEIFCRDSYVRFSARSYIVGEYAEIPFTIRLSAFLSAQLFFRKTPYMKTILETRATIDGHMHKEIIPLTVGEW